MLSRATRYNDKNYFKMPAALGMQDFSSALEMQVGHCLLELKPCH
jgi:hypothetical protein